ncbi:MAG: hypothetical protein ACOYEV_07725 [Candidatus Nanopelagicales bacterium]
MDVPTRPDLSTWLAADHGDLDERARTRLAQVAADPAGESWMASAGLLATDSCGYPVAGGYYDIKNDLAVSKKDPAEVAEILEALRTAWAADFVTTGRARLDRSPL